jgi:hypothetical protein
MRGARLLIRRWERCMAQPHRKACGLRKEQVDEHLPPGILLFSVDSLEVGNALEESFHRIFVRNGTQRVISPPKRAPASWNDSAPLSMPDVSGLCATHDSAWVTNQYHACTYVSSCTGHPQPKSWRFNGSVLHMCACAHVFEGGAVGRPQHDLLGRMTYWVGQRRHQHCSGMGRRPTRLSMTRRMRAHSQPRHTLAAPVYQPAQAPHDPSHLPSPPVTSHHESRTSRARPPHAPCGWRTHVLYCML